MKGRVQGGKEENQERVTSWSLGKESLEKEEVSNIRCGKDKGAGEAASLGLATGKG